MEQENKQEILDRRYMRMARIWAENSYCKRRQVGALIVKDKMIISDGYNGTPSGFSNVCEDEDGLTIPYVLHAEANATACRSKRDNKNSTFEQQQRGCNNVRHHIAMYRMCKTYYTGRNKKTGIWRKISPGRRLEPAEKSRN